MPREFRPFQLVSIVLLFLISCDVHNHFDLATPNFFDPHNWKLCSLSVFVWHYFFIPTCIAPLEQSTGIQLGDAQLHGSQKNELKYK